MTLLSVDSQITFLYTRDLEATTHFMSKLSAYHCGSIKVQVAFTKLQVAFMSGFVHAKTQNAAMNGTSSLRW